MGQSFIPHHLSIVNKHIALPASSSITTNSNLLCRNAIPVVEFAPYCMIKIISRITWTLFVSSGALSMTYFPEVRCKDKVQMILGASTEGYGCFRTMNSDICLSIDKLTRHWMMMTGPYFYDKLFYNYLHISHHKLHLRNMNSCFFMS